MKFLVTGGAGFIGSNIVDFLLQQEEVEYVRALDNLATGHLENIAPFQSNPKFEFLEGDIRNSEDCFKAVEGMDRVCHQAALGSVPRSIEDPLTSHEVNVNGFVNILEACRKEGIQQISYASSSSVYGDLAHSPKVEERVGKVLSPYAATKATNELYAQAYAEGYGMHLTGLRYFNVFGPNQDPNGPYAAVIPLFIKAAIEKSSPTINGDGSITRDFTPIKQVVLANWKALTNSVSGHQAINVACGRTTSLNELWNHIKQILEAEVEAVYGPNRAGDILHSLANIDKLKNYLGIDEQYDFKIELASTIDYYQNRFYQDQ